MKRIRYKKYLILLCAILVVTWVYTLFFPLPLQHRYEYRSVVWVECHYSFALSAGGSDSLFFTGIRADSALSNLSLKRENAQAVNAAQGFWYCPLNLLHLSGNRILTSSRLACPDTILPDLQSHIKIFLALSQKRFKLLTAQRASLSNHLSSYMNTHDVHDEGYNQVAKYKDQHATTSVELNKINRIIQTLLKGDSVKISFLPVYSYRYVSKDGTLSKLLSCSRKKVRTDARITELTPSNQLDHLGTLSLGYPIINFMRFTSPERAKNVILFAFNVTTSPETFSDMKVSRIDGRAWQEKNKRLYSSSLPVLNCAVGAPVVDHRGVLIGMADMNGIVPIK